MAGQLCWLLLSFVHIIDVYLHVKSVQMSYEDISEGKRFTML